MGPKRLSGKPSLLLGMLLRLAFCAASLLAVRPAVAQTPEPELDDAGLEEFMAEVDTDKDGKVSKPELLKFLENDDLGSAAEAGKHWKKMVELTEENFAKMDTDGDGFLDASGVQAMEKLFRNYFDNLGDEEDL